MIDSILDYYLSTVWSISLGGDDVIALLADHNYEQRQTIQNSEVGHSSGWLNVIWNDFV